MMIFQTFCSAVVCMLCFVLSYAAPRVFFHVHFGGLSFQLEPVGLVFINVLSILWFITNLYSLGYFKNVSKTYSACTFASIISAMLLALSGNLITAFIFYELLTIFTFPLVKGSGTEQESKAARKYILILMFCSFVLLLPALVLVLHYCGTLDFVVGGVVGPNFPSVMIFLTFLMFLYGCSKIALVPVHLWLPGAMVAPIPVSALLHAVAVVKAGLFIFLKICIYIYGIDCLSKINSNFNCFVYLVGFSILAASYTAVRQTKLKGLLAYSTINHMSLCLLPLSMFSAEGVKAAVLHMTTHALGKITLFFAAGYWEKVFSIKSIDQLNYGIFQNAKSVGYIFAIAALSVIGIPPLAGFISKAYMIYSLLLGEANYIALGILLLSTLFGVHYFIKVIYRIFFVSTAGSITPNKAGESWMKLAMFITCALVIAYVVCLPRLLSILDSIEFSSDQ